MSRHLQIWEQTKTELNNTISRIKAANSELVKTQDELAKKITQLREDIKYADSSDKPWLVSRLASLMADEARAGEQLRSSVEGAGTPYFTKFVSDEPIYISKHISDPDNNIVKYTSPIAVLRYKEVGEVGKVNGFVHKIREKQLMDIQVGDLRLLDYADPETAFTYDGSHVQIIREVKPREIVVKKENMAASPESLADGQKKYVLGEIIAKMREEQDTVMRAPHQGVTLVKGAAGSGKTNIAFHRIVYLTTEFAQEFRQDNIAVFCFNVALKQYLNNMLSELNIPRVKVFSLDEWVYSIIKNLTNIGWLEYKEDALMKLAKTRKDIIPILDSFYKEYKKQLHQAVAQEEVEEDTQLRIDGYKILNLLYTYEPFLEHVGHHPLSRDKYSQGAKVDHSDQYLLAWVIQHIARAMEFNVFGYYDHVVIDEVQDLMPIQMALINQHHKGSMTLVGDVTQKIFELGVDSWDQFDIKIHRVYELTMCHRATLQTVLFANQLLSAQGENMFSATVGKQGEKPCIFEGWNRTQILKRAVSFVQAIKEKEPQASVAVLSYRNYDLEWFKTELVGAGLDAYIASKKDWEFSPRVAVTTYHQVKGLEFDYVFVLGLNDYEQLKPANMDKVVYTVVTRAQKRVYIGYVKEMPDMLKQVDPDLYIKE